MVDAFQTARPEVLQLGEDVVHYKDGETQGNKKRKFEIADTDEEEAFSTSTTQRRKTRSQGMVGDFVDTMNKDTQTSTVFSYFQNIAC